MQDDIEIRGQKRIRTVCDHNIRLAVIVHIGSEGGERHGAGGEVGALELARSVIGVQDALRRRQKTSYDIGTAVAIEIAHHQRLREIGWADGEIALDVKGAVTVSVIDGDGQIIRIDHNVENAVLVKISGGDAAGGKVQAVLNGDESSVRLAEQGDRAGYDVQNAVVIKITD